MFISGHRLQARDPLFHGRVGAEQRGQAGSGERIDDEHSERSHWPWRCLLERNVLGAHVQFP